MPIAIQNAVPVKTQALPVRTTLAKDLPIRERADDTHNPDPLDPVPRVNPPATPVVVQDLQALQKSLPPLAPGIPPLFGDPSQSVALPPAPEPAPIALPVEAPPVLDSDADHALFGDDPASVGESDADIEELLASDPLPGAEIEVVNGLEDLEDESVEPLDTWGHLDFFQAADSVQTDLSMYPEDDLENFLMSFFLLVPSPEDIQVHLLAKSLGLQPDILEGVIYQVTQKLMQTNLNQGEPNVASS